MKKILYSIIIFVFLVAGISLVVMYNIGDRIINEAIEQAIKFDIGEIDKQGEVILDTPQVAENSSVPDSSTNKPSLDEGKIEATMPPKNSQPQKKGSPLSDKQSNIHVTPVPTQGKGNKQKEVIPVEKIEDIKDKVTASDKVAAAALVLKRLSPSDIDAIKGMLNGGLNDEEMKKAVGLVYERFTPQEIESIKKIYHKYMSK